MVFITGFLIWLGFALLAGAIVWTVYRGTRTTAVLTFTFAIVGAFIGGMLGMYPYIYHQPVPTRVGGLIGAAAGAFFFSVVYQVVDRKAV